jgi:hypothetical protein
VSQIKRRRGEHDAVRGEERLTQRGLREARTSGTAGGTDNRHAFAREYRALWRGPR